MGAILNIGTVAYRTLFYYDCQTTKIGVNGVGLLRLLAIQWQSLYRGAEDASTHIVVQINQM